jgi:hypothetical protein
MSPGAGRDRLPADVRARRAAAKLVLAAVVVNEIAATGVLPLDERYIAASRNIVLPGAGLIEWSWPVAVVFACLAVVALTLFFVWGADWVVGAVWAAALVATVMLVSAAHSHAPTHVVFPVGDAPQVVRASHTVGAILVVMVLVNWLRVAFAHVPGVSWLGRRLSRGRRGGLAGIGQLRSVERARASAIAALARAAGAEVPESDAIVQALSDGRVLRRARNVGAFARLRVAGDPLRTDNAHARAALLLWGKLTPHAVRDFQQECATRLAGVPCSEPAWVRPLDATLAAVALQSCGEREAAPEWVRTFQTEFRLGQRGHRPAWLYTPVFMAAGTASDWEHAAASGICRAFGWIGADDWTALRKRTLAAAARGSAVPQDARLIAAGRMWAAMEQDARAQEILQRATIRGDALAVALERLARVIEANPRALLDVRWPAAECAATPSAAGSIGR